MDKILFYSNNNNKIKEVRNTLKPFKIRICSPKDFDLDIEPRENGKSFAENAKIKSVFGFNKINQICFADDSGICIEALNWGPNIKSKNFLESFVSRKDCLNYIIKKVKLTNKKRAYFQTTICLTMKKSSHIIFEGKLLGQISEKILGKNGFGYDPIFIPDGRFKTLSEISLKDKNSLSHRSIAIHKLINFLSN